MERRSRYDLRWHIVNPLIYYLMRRDRIRAANTARGISHEGGVRAENIDESNKRERSYSVASRI